MKKLVGFIVLAFWMFGGLLLTPGVLFAQVQPGIQIFDNDSNNPGITVNLSGTSAISNSILQITQETATNPGSVIWDFDFLRGLPNTTYSYNIYELGTNLTNPPASALSDTLLLTHVQQSGPVPLPDHWHLEFFSGPLNDTPLLPPLSNATAIIETGALQTPPNGPGELNPFQFQSDLDATSVPEPLSLFLFGAGLVGMAVIRRKDQIFD